MAFCTECGAGNLPEAAYCTSCGVPLSGAPAEPVPQTQAETQAVAPQPPAPPAVPAAQTQAFAPQAPAQPSFIGVLWSSLDTGSRVAGIGAIVAAIAFFLPLYTGEFNGVDLAKADIAWWFRFLLPLAVVALLGFTYNRDLRTKILVGTALCAIGAMWGLQVFGVFKGSEFTAQGQQVGWYALHLGFLAILVGGFMSVLDHTRQLVGVR